MKKPQRKKLLLKKLLHVEAISQDGKNDIYSLCEDAQVLIDMGETA